MDKRRREIEIKSYFFALSDISMTPCGGEKKRGGGERE
jgi:hypothetical protein